ncbi:MAG: hypothetical protein JW888_15670 [Pirellulales bacterium]|nr:hypothetical protein [Pirellulales bacterium]
MTTHLRSTIQVQLGWTWRDSTGTNVVANSNRLQLNQELEDGNGASQADTVWDAVEQSLNAGSSTTFSLDALERDLFGQTITLALASVKAVLVVNRNTSGSGHLLLGGAASDEWHAPLGNAGDQVKIMPGAALLLACPQTGWDVAAGATQLKLAAVADDVIFDMAIVGVAATS